MEFGKVSHQDLTQIRFDLPDDDVRTWTGLRGGTRRLERVGVGAPVWGVKDWVGSVYPSGTRPAGFLEAYGRQFNSIELNTTHYRIPDEVTIRRWRETTPLGFLFNVKILQDISHRRPLAAQTDLIQSFVKSVMGLEDRLGIAFLQLPPAFTPEEIPDLKKFLDLLPSEFQLAVEVRHPRFFVENKLITPLFDLFHATETHAVITDVSGRRDVLHTSLPTRRVLVRMIGNDLHPTDDLRIHEWVERLHTWQKLGLEQVEFFVHQPEDRSAPILINRFIHQLNARCGLDVKPWVDRSGAPPASGRDDPQLGLF